MSLLVNNWFVLLVCSSFFGNQHVTSFIIQGPLQYGNGNRSLFNSFKAIRKTAASNSNVATVASVQGGGGGSNENSMEQLERILQVAIQASNKAGKIIATNSDGADVIETKSTSRDLLTVVDPLCEKVRCSLWKTVQK